MSTRFRRSVKLAPGLKLNLTKTGVGLTAGGKYVRYTKHSGGRNTVGLSVPGTGIYYQKTSKNSTHKPSAQPLSKPQTTNSGTSLGNGAGALSETSESYASLREQLATLFSRRAETEDNLRKAKSKLAWLSFANFMSYLWMFGIFYKGISKSKATQKERVDDLVQSLTTTVCNINFGDNQQIATTWSSCTSAFNELMGSQKIWDVTYTEQINRAQARSYASNIVNRNLVKPSANNLEFIKCDLGNLVLPNANGTTIYVYPTFLILFKNKREFGIFDLKEVQMMMSLKEFVERDGVTSDTEIIKYTWAKTNKDGTKDKRFNGNYQIPVVKYGDMIIEGNNGLEEYFMFSNFRAFSAFAKAYMSHELALSKLTVKAQPLS